MLINWNISSTLMIKIHFNDKANLILVSKTESETTITEIPSFPNGRSFVKAKVAYTAINMLNWSRSVLLRRLFVCRL